MAVAPRRLRRPVRADSARGQDENGGGRAVVARAAAALGRDEVAEADPGVARRPHRSEPAADTARARRVVDVSTSRVLPARRPTARAARDYARLCFQKPRLFL